MIMDGKPLNENERMSVLRTIEGDAEPSSHDFVSSLAPNPNARRVTVILTDEHAKFVRALVACEILERQRELQTLIDPDRFHTIRKDDNEAIRIGTELLEMLKAANPLERG